jgi:hypothetical protein
MRIRRIAPIVTGLSLLLLSTSCRDGLIGPRELVPGDGPGAAGLMEVTISGIGTDRISASAARPTAGSGAAFALSGPGGDGTIQLEPIATGSFTDGVRGSGGVRYVYATFRVRNAQSDGTAYETPRENLTFLAVSTASTLEGSAIRSLRRFDGSAATASIALQTMPTGAVRRTVDGTLESAGADVLQVLTESELATMTAPAGSQLLPYGFVVRNPATPGSRTLAASPAPGQFDGVVTFAFRLPLQPTAAEDPFNVTIMVLPLDDDAVRVTQSLEEQGAGQAGFEQRVAALGAGSATLLGGGAYSGPATTRTICEVRIAGPAGAPTATLSSGGPCTPSGESMVWTGALSTDWDEPGNWQLNRTPVAADTVRIDGVVNQPVISGGDRTVGGLVMTDTLGPVLDLGGGTLVVTNDVVAPAGSLIGGMLRMTGTGAVLRGTFASLDLVGGVTLSGSTTATGPVAVRGALRISDQSLTISVP